MNPTLGRLPLLGPALDSVERWWRRHRFPGSRGYWDDRYRAGATSGAGSYGPMAEFKAEVLNAFVRERGVRSVLEFGCGDGAQLARAEYPAYVGLDVAPRAVEICARRFAGDASKRFFVYSDRFPEDLPPEAGRAELSLSLDVLYHLVEESVFDRHLRDLFASADRFVVVYSSDFDRTEPTAPHVRHRRFTTWVGEQAPAWRLVRHLPNRYPYREADGSGSLADFYFFEKSIG